MSKKNEALYLPIVAKAFADAGLPPELGCALARQESNWDPMASATHPGDLARGGAFGLCQMTMKTGVALDRHCTMAKLMVPAYNAKLAAQLCKENSGRCMGRIEDIIARYNSGKDFWKAPEVTKTHYVPRVQKYMVEYKEAAKAAVSSTPASSPDVQKKPQP